MAEGGSSKGTQDDQPPDYSEDEIPEFKEGARYRTWAHLWTAAQRYAVRRNIVLSKENMKKVDNLNAKLQPHHTRYPEEFVYASGTLACKHHGVTRMTGNYERPEQSSIKIECPCAAKIGCSRMGKYLQINSFNENHNHKVNRQRFELYPENRRLKDDYFYQAKKLLSCNVSSSQIAQYITEMSGKRVLSRDIRNIRVVTDSHNYAFMEGFDQILAMEPGNEGCMWEDEERDVDMIYFQSATMKRNLAKFPELLIMDTTHNMNNKEMKLTTIMVIDNYNRGQVAAHALMANESKEMMVRFLKHFVECNGDELTRTKLMIVDKSTSETRAIEAVLPNIPVHLCLFHVKKALYGQLAGRQLNKRYKAELEDLIDDIVDAHTREEFDEAVETLFEQEGIADYLGYFNREWLKCNHVWAQYMRKGLPTMNTRTTNHLESFHRHIKDQVPPNATLYNCVLLMYKYTQRKEVQENAEEIIRGMKYSYNATDRSPTAQRLYLVYTKAAARKMLAEKAKLKDKDIKFRLTELPDGTFIVMENKQEYVVQMDETRLKCSCTFQQDQLSVCRHGFFIMAQQDWALNCNWVAQRWRQDYDMRHSSVTTGVVPDTQRPVPSTAPLRFNESMGTLTKIGNLFSVAGNDEFRHHLANLIKYWKAWLAGKLVRVLVGNEEAENTHEKSPPPRKTGAKRKRNGKGKTMGNEEEDDDDHQDTGQKKTTRKKRRVRVIESDDEENEGLVDEVPENESPADNMSSNAEMEGTTEQGGEHDNVTDRGGSRAPSEDGTDISGDGLLQDDLAKNTECEGENESCDNSEGTEAKNMEGEALSDTELLPEKSKEPEYPDCDPVGTGSTEGGFIREDDFSDTGTLTDEGIKGASVLEEKGKMAGNVQETEGGFIRDGNHKDMKKAGASMNGKPFEEVNKKKKMNEDTEPREGEEQMGAGTLFTNEDEPRGAADLKLGNAPEKKDDQENNPVKKKDEHKQSGNRDDTIDADDSTAPCPEQDGNMGSDDVSKEHISSGTGKGKEDPIKTQVHEESDGPERPTEERKGDEDTDGEEETEKIDDSDTKYFVEETDEEEERDPEKGSEVESMVETDREEERDTEDGSGVEPMEETDGEEERDTEEDAGVETTAEGEESGNLNDTVPGASVKRGDGPSQDSGDSEKEVTFKPRKQTKVVILDATGKRVYREGGISFQRTLFERPPLRRVKKKKGTYVRVKDRPIDADDTSGKGKSKSKGKAKGKGTSRKGKKESVRASDPDMPTEVSGEESDESIAEEQGKVGKGRKRGPKKPRKGSLGERRRRREELLKSPENEEEAATRLRVKRKKKTEPEEWPSPEKEPRARRGRKDTETENAQTMSDERVPPRGYRDSQVYAFLSRHGPGQLRNLLHSVEKLEVPTESSDDPIVSLEEELTRMGDDHTDTINEARASLNLIMREQLAKHTRERQKEIAHIMALLTTHAFIKQMHIVEAIPTLWPVPHLPNCKATELVKPKLRLRDLRKYSIGNNTITIADLNNLNRGEWLCDNVINIYLGYLAQQENLLNPKTVFMMPSQTAQMWARSNYRSIFTKIPLMEYKWVMLPVNPGHHWFLMVMNMENLEVTIYDSLSSLPRIRTWTQRWMRFIAARNKALGEAQGNWTVSERQSNPQHDGDSCGLFTLMNATAILRGMRTETMRMGHAKNFRVHVAATIKEEMHLSKEPVCEMPDCTGVETEEDGPPPMQNCDNCGKWAHLPCGGLTEKPHHLQHWCCPYCVE